MCSIGRTRGCGACRLLHCMAECEHADDAAQAAAADGKRESELPPTLKLMQQNTRLIVLTLEVSADWLWLPWSSYTPLSRVPLGVIWLLPPCFSAIQNCSSSVYNGVHACTSSGRLCRCCNRAGCQLRYLCSKRRPGTELTVTPRRTLWPAQMSTRISTRAASRQ